MRGRLPLPPFLLALSCLIQALPVAAQQTFSQPYEGARSPRNASYDISVRLDPATQTLVGIQVIRWRNISDEFTREVHLHVPPGSRLTRLDATQPNGTVVALPRSAGPLLRTTVPWEIVPVATVELYVEWQAPVSAASLYVMERWHPRMAVLEDAGWNTAALHADFGSYDVQVTVPAEYEVTATGFAASRQENPDGTVTHRYRAEDVRAFTWHARRGDDGARPWLYVPLAQLGVFAAFALLRRRAATAVLLLAVAAAASAQPAEEDLTPLHRAAQANDARAARALVFAGASVDAATGEGITPMHLALRRGNVGVVEVLLKAGADPNGATKNGETVLMTAARAGVIEAVDLLLEFGAALNPRQALQGETPLMWAAAANHVPVAELLLIHGANVHTQAVTGATALMLAERHGHAAMARLLIEFGAER